MSDAEEKKEIYTTRDIYLASTFVTMGFRVINVDFQLEGHRPRPVGYFNFEDTEELRKAESDFLHGSVQVEPRALFQSLKALKGITNNFYKSPRSEFNKEKFR